MFRFIFLSIFSIYLSNTTLESLSFKYSFNDNYFLGKYLVFKIFFFIYSNQISYSSLNFMIDEKITENFYIMFGLKNLFLENKFNYNLGLQFYIMKKLAFMVQLVPLEHKHLKLLEMIKISHVFI